jgi:hypothetical protein
MGLLVPGFVCLSTGEEISKAVKNESQSYRSRRNLPSIHVASPHEDFRESASASLGISELAE